MPLKSIPDLSSSSHSALLIAATVTAGVLAVAYYVLVFHKKNKKLLPLSDFIPVPLIRKEILSHDTRKFTFALPDPSQRLGLPIGQHLSLRFTNPTTGLPVQRSYTPVSDDNIDGIGQFSLVVKVYRPSPPKFPNGGQMSQHLDTLQLHDTILIKGPKGHVDYHGHGRFHVKPRGQDRHERRCDNLAMIAGGTGVTPMLQLLHAIFRSPTDTSCQVRLLYANQTPDDILLRAELDQLARDFPTRFRVWYTVDRIEVNRGEWTYDTGFVTRQMIERHLCGGDGVATQFFLCGPLPMIQLACLPALTELGYTDKDWVIF